jgi:hypothetical protein
MGSLWVFDVEEGLRKERILAGAGYGFLRGKELASLVFYNPYGDGNKLCRYLCYL